MSGISMHTDTKRILRLLKLWSYHRKESAEVAVLKLIRTWMRLLRKGNMIENWLDHLNYELTYREYWT